MASVAARIGGARVEDRTPAAAGAPVGSRPISLRRFDGFGDAEAAWRDLERDAFASPYQRFDWLEAWYLNIGSAEGVEPLVVAVEEGGQVIAILPFGVARSRGAVVCRWMGGSHVNYGLPLLRPDAVARFDAATVRDVLDGVDRLAGGIDLFDLANQPIMWRGTENPFARPPRRPSPSPSFMLELKPDFESIVRERRSRKSMQTLRRKERKLADSGVAPTLRSVSTPAEARRVLDAFFAQRAARFGEQGIRSLFDEPAARAFVCDLVDRTVRIDPSILRLDYLQGGGEILAIYGGSLLNGRYTCYINSITTGEHARHSPGDILLGMLVEKCCHAGLRDFDLGIGEERYKASWCSPDPLCDVMLPRSLRGYLLLASTTVPRTVKHKIKGNRRLWGLAKRVRRAVFGAPTG